MANKMPVWRSALFVPVNVTRFVEKAHTRGADAVILDLEDSVPLAEKSAARKLVANAAATVKANGPDVLVRINQPLRHAVRDLEACICPQVDVVVVPKVTGPEHLRFIDEIISELEIENNMPVGHTRLVAYIETPQALDQVVAIATSSPRMVGMSLGAEDFCAVLDMTPTSEGLFYANQKVVFAAKSAGILPLGFVGSVAQYSDLDEFRQTIRQARQLGFRGAFGIHPNQIRIMNEEFVATPDEVEQARGILEADALAQQEGRGAFEYNGKMVDAPVVARAREVLNSHERLAARHRDVKP